MIAREPIYAALFSRVAGAADFATTERRRYDWRDEIAFAALPGLFMRQKQEQKSEGKWTLSVDLQIVCGASPGVSPTAVLNPLIDAVEAALAPQATGMQDLGLPAMVQHAYIAGKIEYQDGDQSNQASAIIPVELLCL